jgi:hypothetical protein
MTLRPDVVPTGAGSIADVQRDHERDAEVLSDLEARLRADDPRLAEMLRTGELQGHRVGALGAGMFGGMAAMASTYAVTVAAGPGLGGFVGAMAFTSAALFAMSRWRCPGRA